jgi:hypothetical protein
MAEPSEIIFCFTRSGEIAHALHLDCKTVLGPWVKFTSAETLEKALRYLGATEEQLAAHWQTMQQTGQGSSHIRLLPDRKNLLAIRWELLRSKSESPQPSSQLFPDHADQPQKKDDGH